MREDKRDEIAELSDSRREFLKKAKAVGFAAPVVATFSMSGLMSRAQAQVASNLS